MRQIEGAQCFGPATLRRGKRIAAFAAGFAAAFFAVSAASAQESAWAGIDEAQVRLISGVTAAGGETVPLGLEFKLARDWKVYWRSPGDAGFPPRLDWSGSRNLDSAEISWPAPERFSVLGFETVGYHGAVVLPLSAKLKEPGAAADFALTVDYLACAEICVPVTAKLSLGLPGGPAAPSTFASLIENYRNRIPDDGTRDGLAIENAAARGSAKGTVLEVTARARDGFSSPDLFVEGPDQIYFGVPKVMLTDGGYRAVLALPVSAAPGVEPDIAGKNLTLTLVDGAQAMETQRAITAGPPLAAREGLPETSAGQLALILALAFLGGLILNLMPCVLPVLSLKLLSVIEAGRETRRARIGFLASAAGILVCFLGFAAAAAAFKTAGYAVGWGVQFQQPLFLIAMALIVTLFGCNLWGLFEFRLPGWLGDTALRAGNGKGIAGNFMTGVFATVLATPCSAPFLGTAVGFALARGPAEIFAVFAALGIGLASPYLAVAAAPDLARVLPHPGHWMVTLKKILALALAATAVWLLTVLAAQTSVQAAAVEALVLITLVAALAIAAKVPAMRGLEIAVAAGLAVLAFLAPPLMPREEAAAAASGYWRQFDAAAIPTLVTTGKIVLVDVTADWCITCKVNEALVLDTPEVAGMTKDGSVIAMRADWTRRDDAIGAYLMSFGRYGIPFNAVYGPGAPAGIALPELLTRDALMRAIEKAGGGARAVTSEKPHSGKG